MSEQFFPFDLSNVETLRRFGGRASQGIASLRHLCLCPPYPWGHWLYRRLIRDRCRRLDGDFAEFGVAKGGTSVFLGQLASLQGKSVWALDSFRGLPNPDPLRDNPYFMEGDYGSRKDRGELFDRFRLELRNFNLEHTVFPIRGFFSSSLDRIPKKTRFSFVHVDVDLYKSTLEVLEKLYDRIVDGGFLVIDDFFHHAQGPARASADFFLARNIRPLYHLSFPYSVVLVKGEVPSRKCRRALDGNYYCFDWLRSDQVFKSAIQYSLRRAKRQKAKRELDNAKRLIKLLDSSRLNRSSDIYEYWRSLEDYWEDMDVDGSDRGAYCI